jgi:hypothetical protein
VVAQLAETDQPNGPETLRLARLVRDRTVARQRAGERAAADSEILDWREKFFGL